MADNKLTLKEFTEELEIEFGKIIKTSIAEFKSEVLTKHDFIPDKIERFFKTAERKLEKAIKTSGDRVEKFCQVK